MRKAGALLLLSFLLAGCLDREEKVTVHADGSVDVSHLLKGDAGEFKESRVDALPVGAPWKVTDEDLAKSDGSGTDHVRHAEASFARIEDVPESNGAAGDPAPLHASTSLHRESGKDGSVRYVFERRYVPRAYAWRERVFRRTVPEDVIKALNETKEGAAHEQAEARAIECLLAFEREKTQIQVEDALASVGSPDVTTRLAARADFARRFDARWHVGDLMPFLDGSPDARAAIDRRFRDETASDAIAAACATGPSEAAARAAFERERRLLEATEDLQDESFEVRVEFPVPVVLTDADLVEGGKTAVFRFHGKDLSDSGRVLRAVAEGKP
jgi:hypothetical protein